MSSAKCTCASLITGGDGGGGVALDCIQSVAPRLASGVVRRCKGTGVWSRPPLRRAHTHELTFDRLTGMRAVTHAPAYP